jgi:RNA polymerase sigma-70 factor (ECF subfamily)
LKKTLTKSEFRKYYNTFYSSLFLFANKYLDDLELSKDVVQEVFFKLLDNNKTFDKNDSIKAYLYTSVKNKCLDQLKSSEYRLKHKLTEENFKILASESTFEKELLLEEVSRTVDIALNTLPEKCKQIIKLSMKGYRNIQISEELSISINTVKTQKRIAYQKLRPILEGTFLSITLAIFYFFN